jgi:hypothetical protein
MPVKEGTREYTDNTRNIREDKNTYIIRGVRGFMGFEGNIGFLRFFQPLGAPGHRNFLDRSSGGLRRFHGRLNFWHRRFISSYILSKRSSGSIPLRVLIITAKKNKRKRISYNPKRENSKHNKIIEFTEHLRCHEVEQF